MELFWKAAAAVLVVSILALFLEKAGREYAVLLTLAATVLIGYSSLHFFEPVFSFLKHLEELGSLNSDILEILLKILGIGITAEITGNVCADSGNASMQKGIHFLASAAILYLALPVYTSLLELLQQVLHYV